MSFIHTLTAGVSANDPQGARPTETVPATRGQAAGDSVVETAADAVDTRDVTVRDHRLPNTTEGWTQHVSQPGGLADFEAALARGDESALAAMKDPGFVQALQIANTNRTLAVQTMTNLLRSEHENLKAIIANIRA